MKPVHIGIPNPVENQKAIVESAISLIEINKHLKEIKKIRNEKIKQRKLLIDSFKELNKLLQEFNFPEIQEHEERKKIVKIEKPKETPQPKLSRLDRDLQELKKKLKRIQ